jgi:hypothetical protein
LFFWVTISMRFHPKRRASTDQAPGPSRAIARARAQSRLSLAGSPCREMIRHNSRSTITVATTGVHNPMISSSPAVAMKSWNKPVPKVGIFPTTRMAGAINELPAATRSTRSPTPGQPRANDENSLRTPGSDDRSATAQGESLKRSA